MANASSTPGAPGTAPDGIISSLQNLQIKGVTNTGLQKALKEISTVHEVKEWGDLLAAAPNALNAIGQCFIVAQAGGIPPIKQEKDKTISADLQTNLVHCYDLGLETFAEAESTMSNLRTTIQAIIEYRGIMDRVFDAVEDIRDALESKSDKDLEAGKKDLAEQLGDLKQRALGCTKDTESVVKKFGEWHEEAKKINLAYTERQSEEIAKAEKDPNVVKKALLKIGFMKSSAENKANVIKVLGFCLDNLKQIKESLEHLKRFFSGLHREIEDLNGQRLKMFIRDVSRPNMKERNVRNIRFDAARIRCQYAHADTKASIYLKASESHIMPGIKLLNSLDSRTVMGGGDMQKKLTELGNYHNGALEGIKVFVEQLPTQAQLLKEIESATLVSEE